MMQLGRRMVGVAAVLLLAGLPLPAQSNLCEYRYDGECDEAAGTGLCKKGSDSWDCRREGPPPGPESCRTSRDGTCDEPGGTGTCIPYTDSEDCFAAGLSTDALFFGGDDRVWPDSAQLPWRAIGRLVFANGDYCTATLVGPAVILTAAHCLFDEGGRWALPAPPGAEITDRTDTPEPARFYAAAAGADFAATAATVGVSLSRQFDIDTFDRSSDVDGFDWALLKLDAPIGRLAGWLRLAPLSRSELLELAAGGRNVMQAGYSGDSSLFLSANLDCRIVDVRDNDTVYHECDSLQGDSGSPLFIADGDDYRVIAIDSAVYTDDQGPTYTNMAVDARAFGRRVPRAGR